MTRVPTECKAGYHSRGHHCIGCQWPEEINKLRRQRSEKRLPYCFPANTFQHRGGGTPDEKLKTVGRHTNPNGRRLTLDRQ